MCFSPMADILSNIREHPHNSIIGAGLMKGIILSVAVDYNIGIFFVKSASFLIQIIKRLPLAQDHTAL